MAFVNWRKEDLLNYRQTFTFKNSSLQALYPPWRIYIGVIT